MLVRIVVALLDLLDTMLEHFWNASTNLTTAKGDEVAGSMASILHYGSALFAQLLTVLVYPWLNTT